jgi:hypothetical protein
VEDIYHSSNAEEFETIMTEHGNKLTGEMTEMAKRSGHKIMRLKACEGHAGVRIINSESGIALALVLIISVIALAIMAALVFMITSGTQISGMQKRYRTAQEAGLGGADITYLMIAARGNPNIPLTGFDIPAMDVGGVNCLTEKLNNATFNPDGTLKWDPACDNASSIDPDDPTTYDMTFQIGTGQSYTVYSKVVNTVEGNSGGDEGLLKGGVVTSSGEITVVSVPYLYTLEVDTESTANRAERSKYSILYQY